MLPKDCYKEQFIEFLQDYVDEFKKNSEPGNQSKNKYRSQQHCPDAKALKTQ